MPEKPEVILWTGGPDPKRIFNGGDLYFGTQSIGATAVCLVILSNFVRAEAWFGVALIIPLLVGCLYQLFGRFVRKVYRSKRTIYSISTREVRIQVDCWRGGSCSIPVSRLPDYSVVVDGTSHGTIDFRAPELRTVREIKFGSFQSGMEKGVAPVFWDLLDHEGAAKALLEATRRDKRTNKNY